MAYVLTGKDDWKQWSRDALYEAIRNGGAFHHEKIHGPQDILVSSRMDTTKAIQATAKGASIITYAQLHAFLGDSGGYATGGFYPTPPKSIDMTPMHDLPGWGSF